jgi:glucosamine kinase
MSVRHAYVFGIDGGGTRCRARIRNADGRLIGEGLGGRANLYASVPDAARSIMDALEVACAEGGLPALDPQQAIGCLGLAGANLPGAVAQLRQLLPFRQISVVTDGAAALAGAFSGEDGAIAILGTGAAYHAQSMGKVREIGGWGFHAGDQGSGADLGRLALRRSLLAHDGVLRRTSLTRQIMAQFSDEPLKLIAFARDATAAEYGAFAPLVFECLDAGDAHAKSCVAEGLVTIRASLRAISRGLDKLCLLGGLADRYAPHLEATFGPKLTLPKADAVEGAIILVSRSDPRQV